MLFSAMKIRKLYVLLNVFIMFDKNPLNFQIHIHTLMFDNESIRLFRIIHDYSLPRKYQDKNESV